MMRDEILPAHINSAVLNSQRDTALTHCYGGLLRGTDIYSRVTWGRQTYLVKGGQAYDDIDQTYVEPGDESSQGVHEYLLVMEGNLGESQRVSANINVQVPWDIPAIFFHLGN